MKNSRKWILFLSSFIALSSLTLGVEASSGLSKAKAQLEEVKKVMNKEGYQASLSILNRGSTGGSTGRGDRSDAALYTDLSSASDGVILICVQEGKIVAMNGSFLSLKIGDNVSTIHPFTEIAKQLKTAEAASCQFNLSENVIDPMTKKAVQVAHVAEGMSGKYIDPQSGRDFYIIAITNK